MVVPPPMSAYELQVPGSVNQVVFSPPLLSNNIAVILVDNRVAIFKFTETGKSGSEVKVNAAGGNGFKRCCTFPSLQGIYR
jgi:hypothetical protein